MAGFQAKKIIESGRPGPGDEMVLPKNISSFRYGMFISSRSANNMNVEHR
jgi:hypothetical protein